MPQLSGDSCARLGWLCWAALLLAACKPECPPLSIQEGDYCRWTRDDGGVAGNSGQGGRAGRGSGTASKAGASASGTGGSAGWTCQQDGEACACVPGGSGQDACTAPKPGCCYRFKDGESQRCQCVPADGAACMELGMKPDALTTSTCPP